MTSETICAVCGNTVHEAKEWRPCPDREGAVICGSEHCKNCKYHAKNFELEDFMWCCYYVGRKQEETKPQKEEKIRTQIKIKQSQVTALYTKNWPGQAQRVEKEILKLKSELNELGREA